MYLVIPQKRDIRTLMCFTKMVQELQLDDIYDNIRIIDYSYRMNVYIKKKHQKVSSNVRHWVPLNVLELFALRDTKAMGLTGMETHKGYQV